jgi:hypothetical protein
MKHLETIQKEVLELKPDEFMLFKTWFSQIEESWKVQQIADIKAGLPDIRPTELMKLSPEQRFDILNRAAALAQLTGMNHADNDLGEWLELGIDDGLTND